MSKPNSSLLNNCPEDQRELFKAQLAEKSLLKEVLIKTLEQKINSIRRERESKTTYLNPNWKYKQADSIGELRGLKFLLDILS